MKKFTWILPLAAVIFVFALYWGGKTRYPRPYRDIVKDCGVPLPLAYAVMKAESGFDEKAESGAGAVGLMQVLPSTAEFICKREGIEYDANRLSDGEYNVKIGCLYLAYLLERFPAEQTAVCAYNAGEGTVAAWLADPDTSADGRTLIRIPYGETRKYEEKVKKFRKIYEFYYR